MNCLNSQQIADYGARGHLTVEDIFSETQMDEAITDAETWAAEEIGKLNAADRAWYVEPEISDRAILRKLDNPVCLRPVFRALAGEKGLLSLVEQIIGPGPKVFFSQIFFKAPNGGGPKPAHQDNFYFGPNDNESMVTAWVALDDADESNGCLFFGEGTNNDNVIPHIAPEGEPFNLLIPDDVATQYKMTPAPVRRGGVSFHHGNTLHQSSTNRSDRWRRACAMHYGNRETQLVNSALTYDMDAVVLF